MVRSCKKRVSKNPDPRSAGRVTKKLKTEVNMDSINNEGHHEKSGKSIQVDFAVLDHSHYFCSWKTYHIKLDEQDPNHPDECPADEKIFEKCFIQEDLCKSHTGKRYISKRLIEKKNIGQVVQLRSKNLTKFDNILRKFRKVERKYDSNKTLKIIIWVEKDSQKPADIRSNLKTGLKTIIRKIIKGKEESLDKPFKCKIKNADQNHYLSKIKNIVLTNKSFFESFIKKPKAKSNYNPYSTKPQLKIFILKGIVNDAYQNFIDLLFAGVTSFNLEERLGFCPKDPKNFDVEELRKFLKNMCMKVVETDDSTKIIESLDRFCEASIKNYQDCETLAVGKGSGMGIESKMDFDDLGIGENKAGDGEFKIGVKNRWGDMEEEITFEVNEVEDHGGRWCEIKGESFLDLDD